jgi:hypothetical protein
MAWVLAASGLGWGEHTDPGRMAVAITCGAIVYAAVLAAGWFLAGRPAGPETDVLALLRRFAR